MVVTQVLLVLMSTMQAAVGGAAVVTCHAGSLSRNTASHHCRANVPPPVHTGVQRVQAVSDPHTKSSGPSAETAGLLLFPVRHKRSGRRCRLGGGVRGRMVMASAKAALVRQTKLEGR